VTDQANPTLGKIEDLFQSLVWDNLVEAALTALFTEMPFLSIWPIGPLICAMVKAIAGKLFEGLRLMVDMTAIILVNETHRRKFDNAVITLKLIAEKSGTDSDEYRKAKENAKIALAQFVHFGAAG
jgi:hypothetical protein